MSWNTPDGLKYAKSDEWVRVEGDTGVIGVTDYAQDQLSDVVYVELPAVGDSLAQGDSFGTIESVKAASDLTMPAGGEVIEVNSGLEDTPEIVNSDPFGAAWMMKIKLVDTSELDALMDAAAYAKYCDEREQ